MHTQKKKSLKSLIQLRNTYFHCYIATQDILQTKFLELYEDYKTMEFLTICNLHIIEETTLIIDIFGLEILIENNNTEIWNTRYMHIFPCFLDVERESALMAYTGQLSTEKLRYS